MRNVSYMFIYPSFSNIQLIYEQFFLIFSNLIICKRNNVKDTTKIFLSIIFCFLIIIFFLVPVILLKKERYMNIYGFHFIYNYI